MNNLPIEHLSYSALSTLVSNPQQFKKNYILNIWDFRESPSAIVGKAFHKTMEMYYAGMDWDKSVEKGQQFLDGIKPEKVNWGKTGSMEKVLKSFYAATQMYKTEELQVGKPLFTELSATTNFTLVSGLVSPLPLKAVTDLVSELKNEIVIWDWKTTTAFSDLDEEQPDYIIQSMFNFYTVRSKVGRDPSRMIFVEVKTSGNKDGSSQIQLYEIDYKSEKSQHYFSLFEKMYTGVIMMLSNPNYIFLPNYAHQFSGAESWEDFVNENIDFEMPENVTHKSSLIVLDDKEKKVQSTDSTIYTDQTLTIEGKVMAKLLEFGVPIEHDSTVVGANVTLMKFKPKRGVKVSEVVRYENDIKLALAAKSLRILAPIPETQLIGIEVNNKTSSTIEYSKVKKGTGLTIPIGRDVEGKDYKLDLARAPHLLVAGTTGSGKSVFLNSLIQSLSSQNTKDDCKLILIDPKETEFSEYSNAKNLVMDVITEAEEANEALEWALDMMNSRYKELKSAGVKDIRQLRAKYPERSFPYIVIVIDEVNDLFLNPLSEDIPTKVIRLLQKARASGIHLVLATQRPSVDVVSGLLKANLPTRISFRTATATDSKVILDQNGAEELLGNGDMLLLSPLESGLVRLQGYLL